MSEERHPVEILADEFATRLRNGDQPSIDEYAARYPDHADLIRAVFPSVAAVERVAAHASDSAPQAGDLPKATPSAYGDFDSAYGDFDIVRRIGSGGMGVVYEAIQRSLQRRVALKVMNDATSMTDKHRIRFRREAAAAAGLHHTNIVPIFGIGESNGVQYYAMQLIDGATLQEIIEILKRISSAEQIDAPKLEARASQAAQRLLRSAADASGAADALPSGALTSQTRVHDATLVKTAANTQRLDPRAINELSRKHRVSADRAMADEAIPASADPPARDFTPPGTYYRNVAHIIANAANALAYAHHSGILHRDIKPANLLLDRDGTIWITDFGLARLDDGDGQTQTGELLGTLRYMAPEQIRGGGDHRMDIYSLGITLFELLTLECGLESPKSRLIDPMGHSQVRFSKAMQRRVPRDLQTIVLKACALAPQDRYARASLMEEDLRRFLEDRPILARRASPWEHLGRWARRNPLVAALTASLFGLLMTLALVLGIWNRQQQATLAQLSHEYQRAESNLIEKTKALERANSEQARAETNMQMAVEAFDQIMNNIAARGSPLSGLDLDDEESPEFVDANLTQADIELLESLAAFFDRFAKENSADLRIETAIARRRVGEIQHRIGKLDDAVKSLNQSIAEFQSIRAARGSQGQAVLEELAARQELIAVLGKRGQLPRANALFAESRRILESDPAIQSSTQGQFALAKLLGSMVNIDTRMTPDRRRRPAAANLNRPANPPAQQARWKRQSEYNAESLAILESLVRQTPGQSVFQLALARAYKDQVQILIRLGDTSEAEAPLLKAIAILDELLTAHPDSASYRYELADALSINIAFQKEDIERCARALELCDPLIAQHPNAPQYLALKASILTRMAVVENPLENRGEKALEQMRRAIEIQANLAARFPEAPLYAITLAQYYMRQSELYFALRRPEKARDAIASAAAVAKSLEGKGIPQPVIKSFLERIRERNANLQDKSNE